MLGDEMGLSEGGAMAYGAGRRDVCGEGVWVGAYGAVGVWAKKMGLRRVPIFVNLKSNTMKNTMQRYRFPEKLATVSMNNCQFIGFY